ncbi:MAG TPA: winged helix-turn-helix domain-containing protein [Pyrinomonadaceae bacterium]|nr:winged helix-turn-helix domain-containing protein [Pyrinomonadaceae bacterium]
MPGTILPNTRTHGIVYAFGPFRLDLARRRLSLNGNPISLPSRTFDILRILVEHRGELVTKEHLLEQVWPDRFVEENNLSVRMSELRKALQDSAESRFIETVSGYGYRFVAKVKEIVDARAETRAELQDDAFKSMAVLPLVNENSQQQLEYVCDGITESLITSLSHISNLRVMSRSTVFRYKSSDLDPRTVGEELRVAFLLVGKVNHANNHLVFDLEMIDAKSGWHLWGGKYKRRVSDLVTLPDEIVRQVVPNLELALTPKTEKRLSKAYPANSKAYELYMKGRYYLNKRALWWTRRSINFFKRAIEQDPLYALAFCGLADSYLLIAGFELRPVRELIPKAKAAVLQALELDSNLADARLTNAKIMSTYEFDWNGAEREFRLAIQLNPFHADVRQYYANFLTKLGHFDEAVNEINKAYRLDPLSIPINLTMAKVYYFARKPALAMKKARELLEIEPGYGPAMGFMGFACLEMGRPAEAVEHFKIMISRMSSEAPDKQTPEIKALDKCSDPEAISFLGYSYGVAGERNHALETLDKLMELRKTRYIQPQNVAVVYLGLGEDDAAFEWLDKAVIEQCGPITYMKVWPFFDRVRSDPRYKELLRRLRLPE